MRPDLKWASRREFATGLGVSLALLATHTRGRAEYSPEYDQAWRVLRARSGSARLRGPDRPATTITGYDGLSPGPLLRVKRGEELRVRLINELDDATTLHWHGLRLPNAMDGVPHLTQAPVVEGGSFDYRFTPPDAGTFWYHAHFISSEQVSRGLYGPLIVDETERVAVDRDIALVLDDWRLNSDDSIAIFGGDTAREGRLGKYPTVNGVPAFDIAVKANERIRLRLINAAGARILPLRLEGHRATIMAIDGQPAAPFIADGGRLVLGPGNRIDLFVDATLTPGSNAPFLVLADGEVPLARIVYDSGAPARAAPLPDAAPLPNNPLPQRMDFTGALKLDVPIGGGAIWAPANRPTDVPASTPLFSAPRGRTVMLGISNPGEFTRAMHLHGHHFRLLDRLDDGWKPFWLDTIVVPPRQTVRIAFVADNPGKWQIQSHTIERGPSGVAGWFAVT
jgi:FtsP/CotA-like multicopper oxidase with cupredoxin domain